MKRLALIFASAMLVVSLFTGCRYTADIEDPTKDGIIKDENSVATDDGTAEDKDMIFPSSDIENGKVSPSPTSSATPGDMNR